ncbi:MAG: ATP-binding protein [Butyrivibrio sp.]|nr:ATP-binding protein [Butyrivibrio sp.]
MDRYDLILYGKEWDGGVIDAMFGVAEGRFTSERDMQAAVNSCIGHILEVSEKMGFRGNLWQAYLAYLIAFDENAFSISCERRGYVPGGINRAAMLDFEVLRGLFCVNLREFDSNNGTCLSILLDFENNNETEKYFNKRIRDRITALSSALAASDSTESFFDKVCVFYKEIGVGSFGMFKAFRLGQDRAGLTPVISTEHIRLSHLIGYELQKKKLTDNTEAFLAGKSANNVLLFGDSGTGKSSSVKALLNEYYDRGLRMIELYKHQFKQLSLIINQIKDRNYKFIIFMDDLSFEEFETEYKYLKAVIEGGLEKKPDNVLIYATSNRRHLVRERFSDREEADDDKHSNDTVQEKLSLAARFGVSIYYGSPDKKQFNEIVRKIAQRNEMDIDEETLLSEANKWELSHGGLSGRTAQQFINYLGSNYEV